MNMAAILERDDTIEFATLPATPHHAACRLEFRWLNRDLADSCIAVFLHEGLGSIAMWKDWPQQVCDTLRCRGLVYSRPGYGRSTPRAPNEKWPVAFMHHQACEILPVLLDAVGINTDDRRRMWLVGHSDGGSIALLYAATFGDALAGAIVLAPHVMVEDVSVASIEQARVAYERTNLRDRLARYHKNVDSAFRGWNDIWLDPAFRAWNIEPELTAIRCPLLAIQGYDDEYGTMAHMDSIARHVPHAQVVKLDQCGHSPHRDAPANVNDAIVRFIDSKS
jgi:pimeloyl-ACP methyl ester carboxylesterase